MWSALTQLPSAIQEWISLTREQNSLLRELLLALGQRPSTPRPLHRGAGPSSRTRTAADVTIAPRLSRDLAEQQARHGAASAPGDRPLASEDVPDAPDATPPSPPTA